MLNYLRQSVSGWTAKILLGLLVLSFAVWGIADVFRNPVADVVLTAGETEVDLGEYRIAYQRVVSPIERQLRRRLTPEEAQMFGIDQQVLSTLAGGAVLDEQARRIDLGLSEDRLARQIASDPAFQDQGGDFSRVVFARLLNNVGLSEAEFIRDQEQVAIRSQIVDAVSDGAEIPTAFATALGLYNGTRRTIDYVTLAPSLVQPVQEPSEEVLRSYFEENVDRYAAPEYRAISYAALTAETIADPSTIGDERVREDYEANLERYTTPERRGIQQMVFADREAAETALAALGSSTDFETVAQNTGRSLADIELGLLARDEIPDQAIAETAFSLEAGETSQVIEGRFGPTVIRVTEIQPKTVQPFEEVSEEIRQELALAAANDTILDAYDAFDSARAGGATLAEAAARAGIEVQTVEVVDRSGQNPQGEAVELPGGQELVEAAFESEVGLENLPVDIPAGYVFYEVTSVKPARQREFEEVRAQVLEDWIAGETQRLLTERAAALEERVESGESLDALAQEIGATVETAEAVTRQAATPILGQQAVSAAFSGGKGLVAAAPAPEGEARILLKVVSIAPPADPLSNVTEAQREQLSASLQNDFLQSYVGLLQGRYPVSVNPQAIEIARTRAR